MAAHPVRYSQPTDAGQMEVSGPPLTALSADELREWADFLRLIIRQAERLAAQKDGAHLPISDWVRCPGSGCDRMLVRPGKGETVECHCGQLVRE